MYHVSGEALFLHQSQLNEHTWGENSFDIAPGSANFPNEAAANAGLDPAFRLTELGAPEAQRQRRGRFRRQGDRD